MQNLHCYYIQTTTYHGTISPDFELNQLHVASSQDSFCQQMEDYLVLQPHKHTGRRGGIITPKLLLLVPGEGAEDINLTNTIRRAMVRKDNRIHHKRSRNSQLNLGPLISQEPTITSVVGHSFASVLMLSFFKLGKGLLRAKYPVSYLAMPLELKY